jgi:PQQ-dependent catabolism-associated CXXCW motif protein
MAVDPALSGAAVLAACLLLGAAGPEAAPEPPGLWSGPMQGPVPATLAGAVVLSTAQAAAAYLTEHKALPIDVAAAPLRPPAMARDMPWLPSPRQDIPGSLWLPDAGAAVLRADRASAFLAAVARGTGGDPQRYLMVYCHPGCWGSWNAARRLVQAGFRHVAWFPGGLEGWSGADLPLGRTTPTPY